MSNPTPIIPTAPSAPASPAEPTQVADQWHLEATAPRTETTNHEPHSNPLADVKPETLRTHPVAYAALAIAVFALLISVVAARGNSSDDFRQVRIGANDCVIGQDAGVDVLYCRTAAVPAP